MKTYVREIEPAQQEIRVLKGPQGESIYAERTKGGWVLLNDAPFIHKAPPRKNRSKTKAQRKARKIARKK